MVDWASNTKLLTVSERGIGGDRERFQKVVDGRKNTIPQFVLTLHRHHRKDFCIKIASDDSHFSVSLNCKEQSH